MRPDLKQKAMRRIAGTAGAASLRILEAESVKAGSILASESRYDILDENLDLLDCFAYRVHKIAVDITASLIERLRTLKITYVDDDILPEGEISEYQNAQTLTVRAIDVLIRLRYLETNRVLGLLVELSIDEDGDIQKKAIEGLEVLASFDLSVFYGDDEQGGIGPAPQEQIVDEIESLGKSDLKRYSLAILTLAQCLLSPTMQSTSSTYQSVTWTNAAVPSLPEIVSIRDRAIGILRRLYELMDTVSAKLHVIGSLLEATRTHHTSSYGDDVQSMIDHDTVEVLRFFQIPIQTEDLEIIQKIEHDSYWIFYRSNSPEIDASAQAIEQAISGHEEYQIYRNLIGFEGIFSTWSDLRKDDARLERMEEHRQGKASEYAQNITADNYEEWRQRILRYVQTQSDDMATFPFFFQFLREFAIASPSLALDLVMENSEQIQRFLIPVLRGLWASDQKGETRVLINSWIGQNRYLLQCTKLFVENNDLDPELLSALMDRATEVGDTDTINMVILVVISNYDNEKGFLLREFLMPAIRILTAHSDTRWIFEIWYRRETKVAIRSLDEEGIDLILENLLCLKEIDYHSDEILSLIAQREPEKVLNFFGHRLTVAAQKTGDEFRRFDAIPYELHKLREPLSNRPEQAVQAVRGWYDENYGMFIYGGAKFLQSIFPDFPDAFEAELLKILRTGEDDDLKIVLAVLRNYEGEPFIHGVCKEIIRSVPQENELLTEVTIALEGTGVVAGAYGFAEAYDRKAEEVRDWLTDPDERVRSFAEQYIDSLQKMSAAERLRADERIELRKHRYGE